MSLLLPVLFYVYSAKTGAFKHESYKLRCSTVQFAIPANRNSFTSRILFCKLFK